MTAIDIQNNITSAKERLAFLQEPPDRFVGYANYTDRTVTTWTGDRLGRIIRWSQTWRNNFGDNRVSLTVRGDNGIVYTGLSSGDGMVSTFRRKKD